MRSVWSRERPAGSRRSTATSPATPASSSALLICALDTGISYRSGRSAAAPNRERQPVAAVLLESRTHPAEWHGDPSHRPATQRGIAGQRRAETMTREQTEQQARRRAGVAAVEDRRPARGTDPVPGSGRCRLARSGEISAPSCRSTRALERASSEVSAPPTWLTPRASAPNSRARWVMLLSPGSANRAANPHRSSPSRNSRGGLEVGSRPVRVARLEQPPQLAQLDSSTLDSASTSGIAILAAGCPATCPGLLAARRVVSRAPVPYDTPPSRAIGERLGEGIRHGLREVAGPGELPVVGRGVDENGLRLEAPPPRTASRARAARVTVRARASRRRRPRSRVAGPGRAASEPGVVGAGEGMASGEAVAQSRIGRPGHDRRLDAADVGQDGARLEAGRQPADEIQSRPGRARPAPRAPRRAPPAPESRPAR